jgi:hypothetical protein
VSAVNESIRRKGPKARESKLFDFVRNSEFPGSRGKTIVLGDSFLVICGTAVNFWSYERLFVAGVMGCYQPVF